jgi:hypothetical protein
MRLMSGRHNYLRLLEISPFERRPRGGWRFGAKMIREHVVDRLVASGRARIEGDHVYLVPIDVEELVRRANAL